MIQRTCIYDWLSRLVCTKYHQKVTHHSCFLFFVEFYNLFGRKFDSNVDAQAIEKIVANLSKPTL